MMLQTKYQGSRPYGFRQCFSLSIRVGGYDKSQRVLNPPPPPHSTGRSWRSRIFSKTIPNRRGSVDNHTIDASSTLPLRFYYASVTLLLRSCYDPTTTMKIWLRLVYSDGDVAATLLRPWRWSYAFVALLYPFSIESEIPIRFYYDLGASTALLPFLLRFMSF